MRQLWLPGFAEPDAVLAVMLNEAFGGREVTEVEFLSFVRNMPMEDYAVVREALMVQVRGLL